MEPFTQVDREKILDYFGQYPEKLSAEAFEQKHRELRSKYHPDVFAKYSDETIKELAEEKFKEVERLAKQIREYINLDKQAIPSHQDGFASDARFAGRNIKIEIITQEKDLKYHLFGTHYRWLQKGDKYKIKGTQATIIIDENYSNHSIGFRETVKLYLTFSEKDAVEDIIGWLYTQLAGRASRAIISGTSVKIDYLEMLMALKRKTVLRLGT